MAKYQFLENSSNCYRAFSLWNNAREIRVLTDGIPLPFLSVLDSWLEKVEQNSNLHDCNNYFVVSALCHCTQCLYAVVPMEGTTADFF